MPRPIDRLTVAAFLVPLFIIFVAFSVLTGLPRSVWASWGKRRNINYCEPLQNHSAVLEPHNSWSNIGYAIIGALALAAGVDDWRSSAVASPSPPASSLRAQPIFSIAMAVTWLGLSASSFLFHAAHTRGLQQWDVGFTSNAALVMCSWSACSLCLEQLPVARRQPRATVGAFLLSLVVIEVSLIVWKFEYSATWCLSTLIGIVIFLECIVLVVLRQRTRRQLAMTVLAVFSMLCAWIVRDLEVNKQWGKPLCLYHNWFQPHSVWHYVSALAIALQYASWRLPPPAATTTTSPLDRPCCARGGGCCTERRGRAAGAAADDVEQGGERHELQQHVDLEATSSSKP